MVSWMMLVLSLNAAPGDTVDEGAGDVEKKANVWQSDEIRRSVWLQLSPGVVSIPRLETKDRNLGWTGGFAFGLLVPVNRMLISVGSAVRVTVPRGTTATTPDGDVDMAIVRARPSLDLRFGGSWGAFFPYVGVSHGLSVEVGFANDTTPIGYSPGLHVGAALLVWRGLYLGLDASGIFHPATVYASGAFRDARGGAIDIDFAVGWRFG